MNLSSEPGPLDCPNSRGFTQRLRPTSLDVQDDPRSRGVYNSNARMGVTPCGSSPLARGLLGAGDNHGVTFRIIPARAGFTVLKAVTSRPSPDHPRSRGVYRLVRDAEAVAGGSSPLARGLREAAANALKRARIIPARAGFTRDCGGVWLGSADHPRSRGVYPNARIKILPALGSSPLARGLLYKQFRSLDALRIIPARAGFTSEYRTSYSRKPDHPRSRGVYIQVAVQLAVDWGSSPLARGLLGRP